MHYFTEGFASAAVRRMYGSVKPTGSKGAGRGGAINIDSNDGSSWPDHTRQDRAYLIGSDDLDSVPRLGRQRSRWSKYTRNLVHSANVIGLVAVAALVALFMFLNNDFSAHGTSDASGGSSYKVRSVKPHIVFILSDDQGMGDMDFDGSDFEGLMPTIRALNEAGVNLTYYYSAAVCTPARSSLMTGKYSSSIGMHHSIVMGTQPWGLPLSERLLPQYLQDAGYNTYIIGKWHLGLYSPAALPNARGFNHSFGFYGGYQVAKCSLPI